MPCTHTCRARGGAAPQVGLDVRLNATVTVVDRSGAAAGGPVRLVVEYADGGHALPTAGGASGEQHTPPRRGSAAEELCDGVVLSGPITQFVRGSNDGTRPPILDASAEEFDLFAPKEVFCCLANIRSRRRGGSAGT